MEEIFKCPLCGREFFKLSSFRSHLGIHTRNGDIVTNPYNLRNSGTPDSHIRNDQGKITKYVCKCGRSFTNKQSYCSHCSHCEVRTGKKDKSRGSNIQDWWNKLKSDNPDKFHELKSKAGKASVESSTSKYGDNLLTIFSKTPSKARDEAHKKQSKTRRLLISSGKLNLPKGSRRSYGSYFNNIFIRSTYEAIYIVYLNHYGIEWKYESERVIYNGKLSISDFNVNGHLVEIKGNISEVLDSIKPFYESGYSISYLGPKDIDLIKSHLRKIGYKIDELVTDIISYRRINRNHPDKLKRYLNWTIMNNSISY